MTALRDGLYNALPAGSGLRRQILAPRLVRRRSVEEPKDFHVDPVVAVALEHLTRSVYRPLRISGLRLEERDLRVTDPHARTEVIHTLKTLHHYGHELVPHYLQRWALARGWAESDALLLRDYASGVVAGVRYATGPSPFGYHGYQQWVDEAGGRSPRI